MSKFQVEYKRSYGTDWENANRADSEGYDTLSEAEARRRLEGWEYRIVEIPDTPEPTVVREYPAGPPRAEKFEVGEYYAHCMAPENFEYRIVYEFYSGTNKGDFLLGYDNPSGRWQTVIYQPDKAKYFIKKPRD